MAGASAAASLLIDLIEFYLMIESIDRFSDRNSIDKIYQLIDTLSIDQIIDRF